MERTDLIGVFYDDEYLLKISERYVQLNTNIGSDHKPFYPIALWREKYEFKVIGKCIKLSENLWTQLTSDATERILLIIPDGRKNIIILKRYR